MGINKQIWNGKILENEDRNLNKLPVDSFISTLEKLDLVIDKNNQGSLGSGMYQVDIKYKWSPKTVHIIYQDLRSGDKKVDDRHRFQINKVELRPNEPYFYVGGYKTGDNTFILVAIITKVREINQNANTSSRWIDWEYLYRAYETGICLWSKKEITYLACDQDHLEFMHNAIITRSLDEYVPKVIKTSQITPVVQTILYGAPGTGKSHKAKEITADMKIYRTTFHPDTDYSSFVGAYKPVPKKENDEIITYKFEAQVFTKAYCEAWSNYLKGEENKRVCLLVEEINRGNCAQIFGDLFQLLDRSRNGFSEYSLVAQKELKDYLSDFLKGLSNYSIKTYYNSIRDNSDLTDNDDKLIPEWKDADVEDNEIRLCLPPNMSIVGTMNTSDQSLFPMDSAFKRRWDWMFVPIEYDLEESQFIIVVDDDHKYLWLNFLRVINDIIYAHTKSEDKQMGNFFVKGDANFEVNCDQFVSKVMYFLWSEICKDNPRAKKEIFLSKQISDAESEEERLCEFTFSDLFTSNRNSLLVGFMRRLEIENISGNLVYIDPEETSGEDDNQKGEHTVYIDNLINYIKASEEEPFTKFKSLFPQDYKTHNNGFVVGNKELGPNCWVVLSRNKDVNVVSFGNSNPELMGTIYDQYGSEIQTKLEIPKIRSNKRNDSRWMFSEKQAQAKLTKAHELDKEAEFIWFVETALKLFNYFSEVIKNIEQK